MQGKKNVFTSLCSDVSLFFFFPIDRVQKSYSLQLFLSLSLSELDSFITCGDPCPVRDELEAKNIKKEMMKMNTGTTPSLSVGGGGVSGNEWESRPGGMVVQRRTDQTSDAPRVIRVRVKYLSVYHEININSQSSFGKTKKIKIQTKRCLVFF